MPVCLPNPLILSLLPMYIGYVVHMFIGNEFVKYPWFISVIFMYKWNGAPELHQGKHSLRNFIYNEAIAFH